MNKADYRPGYNVGLLARKAELNCYYSIKAQGYFAEGYLDGYHGRPYKYKPIPKRNEHGDYIDD